jgi:hypothetical protein
MQTLLEPVLQSAPDGAGWLPALLTAAPLGPRRLGEVAHAPGPLSATLTLAGLEGRRACFYHPVAVAPELLRWLIEHPERLSWPSWAGRDLSPEALRLRRALMLDDPPGSRERARARALELLRVRSAFAREWWRLEETLVPDCLLVSDRLVLILVAADRTLALAGEHYAQRTVVHSALEASLRLAEERRRPAVILISDVPIADARPAALTRTLGDASPHLDATARAALAQAYLGNLTWEQAERALAGACDRAPHALPQPGPT